MRVCGRPGGKGVQPRQMGGAQASLCGRPGGGGSALRFSPGGALPGAAFRPRRAKKNAPSGQRLPDGARF